MASIPLTQETHLKEKPIAIFSDLRYRKRRTVTFWLIIVLLLVLGVLAYWGYQQFLPRINLFGPSILWINVKLLIIALPILLILLLWLLVKNWPRCKQFVQIFTDKIQLTHGDKATALHWDEINRFYLDLSQSSFLGIKCRPRQLIRLTGSEHPDLEMDGRFEKFRDLVNLIRSFTFPSIYDKTQTEIKYSGEASFGTIKIQPDKRLTINGKLIPCENVREFNITEGLFRIRLKNGSVIKIPAHKLYNHDVLIKILESYCSSAPKR